MSNQSFKLFTSLKSYRQRLANLPVPGLGAGFHPGMLGLANIGAKLGISPRRVFLDLRQKASHGYRLVADGEIIAAIKKAYGQPQKSIIRRKDKKTEPRKPPTHRVEDKVTAPSSAEARLQVHQGRRITETDLTLLSPVRIPSVGGERNLQAATLFETLYKPDDQIFIGDRCQSYEPTPARILAAVFAKVEAKKLEAEFIIPNVLSGKLGTTKTGKPSYRADSCVESPRYLVSEFDNVPLEEQLAFWAFICLPVAVLVTSGGKSVHGWIDLRSFGANSQGLNQQEWQSVVINRLKPELVKCGADCSTFHPARLSRLAGQIRREKATYQQLLYLNPAPTGDRIIEG